MPKIIENLKDRLLWETKKQLDTSSYASVTVRSVAKACGVGVGTVYNYFPSKEALIATHLLEDWKGCMELIARVAEASPDPQPVLLCMYRQLTDFAHRHRGIFRDEGAMAAFAGAYSRYHSLLRSQLAAPLERFCESPFAAQFAAESLLTWTMAGNAFEEIYGVLKKIL